MNIYVRMQDNDLCKYLSPEQCASMLSHSQLYECPVSTSILSPGAEPEGFIMLQSGELEIRNTHNRTLGSIFPGEIFGEIAFLGISISGLGLTSVKPSSYQVLPFSVIQNLIDHDEVVAARIMAALNDSLCLKTIHLTHRRNHG